MNEDTTMKKFSKNDQRSVVQRKVAPPGFDMKHWFDLLALFSLAIF
jgi:hypothetical protein